MITKNKLFHMRLSPLESNAIEQLAKRAGVSKSMYVRGLLRVQAEKAKIPVDFGWRPDDD